MTNKDIWKLYHKIGLNLRLRDDVVKEIIESQYKFTKEKISELEFNSGLSEDEFNKLRTNFAYRYIGKLFTNYRLINNYIKRKKHGRRKRDENNSGEGINKDNKEV